MFLEQRGICFLTKKIIRIPDIKHSYSLECEHDEGIAKLLYLIAAVSCHLLKSTEHGKFTLIRPLMLLS